MDQMAGTGPLHVFLSVRPLAQCNTQIVLPKPTHVTISCCLAPHAGMALHPSIVDITKVAGSRGSSSVCGGLGLGCCFI